MSVARRLASIVIVAATAAAVVACGVEIGEAPDEISDDGKQDGTGGSGSNPNPNPNPNPPLTATAFLQKVWNQYCDEGFRCKNTFPLGPTGFAQEFGATIQACYADFDAYYLPQAIEQSITAGRILYSAAAAELCLPGIKYPPDCNTYWQTQVQAPAACGLVLVGKVANGGTCGHDFDCANANSICDNTTKRCVLE